MKPGRLLLFPLLVGSASAVAIGGYASQSIRSAPIASRSISASLRDTGAGDTTSPQAYLSTVRALPGQSVPPGAYVGGRLQAAQVRPLQVASPAWTPLGPVGPARSGVPDPSSGARGSVSGRVTAIAFDPRCTTSCSTFYAGAAGGGLWRTTDGGVDWTELLPAQSAMAIGVIVIDPKNTNIMYLGTGDPSRGSAATAGTGILRSIDGGITWTTLGAAVFAGRSITRIVLDPRSSGSTTGTIYASTTYGDADGSTTGGGQPREGKGVAERGLYVSRDGGATWRSTGPKGLTGVSFDSLTMSPTDPNTLYVTVATYGIYRSTDGGLHWTHLTRGLPTRKVTYTYSTVALAPSDPRVLYAAFGATVQRTEIEELYQSLDGGASWARVKTAPNTCDTQCWSNMTVTIDPTNPRTVYLGGTANYQFLFLKSDPCRKLTNFPKHCNAALARSTNGGATWQDIGENHGQGPIHPDTHALTILTANPQVMLLGNDGGIFESVDGGASWASLNPGLDTMQTQSVSADTLGRIYTGTQDNGTFVYQPATRSWTHVLDSDGGMTAVDPANPNISYAERYGASLSRNTQGAKPYAYTDIAAFVGDYVALSRGNFFQPFAIAPSASATIFAGSYRVWRTRTRGGTDVDHTGYTFDSTRDTEDWVPISFDLSCGARPSRPMQQCSRLPSGENGIAALAVAPTDANVVVAADSSGRVWLTRNALAPVQTTRSCAPSSHSLPRCNFLSGVTWRRIDHGLPNRFPTAIAFMPGSTTQMVMSFSGYNVQTPQQHGHVFLTQNSGQSWTSLSGTGIGNTLPNLPFSDVIVNPINHHLYASSDDGVYGSLDNGQHWGLVATGLPSVPVFQITLDPANGQLLAATYGRGIWSAPAP